MKATKQIIGSVSSSTMREADLIPAFLDTLAELNPEQVQAIRANPENACIWTWLDDSDANEMPEAATWLLDELFGDLEQYAPPYFYFGARSGDGADYGYWPCEDLAQDVRYNDGLVVSDLEKVPAGYSGEVLHVNDHGNCTLYAVEDGKLTEVWSIV